MLRDRKIKVVTDQEELVVQIKNEAIQISKKILSTDKGILTLKVLSTK